MTGRRSNLPPRVNGRFSKADNGLPSKSKDPRAYYAKKYQLIKNDPLKYKEHCLRSKMQTRVRGIVRCKRMIAIYTREILELQLEVEKARGQIYRQTIKERTANAQAH